MDSTAGHYDKQGNACIKLHLHGAKHSAPGLEYIGIIDTGFTGFIQVPFSVAFALGIPLDGTNTFTLANGAKHVALMGLVFATFSGREELGVAVLSTSSDILIGMDFLRRFNRALVVSQNGIFLVDENTIPRSS